MDSLNDFLTEIANGKFKVGYFKINESIKKDGRFQDLYNWLYEKYVTEGRGLKSMIKDYNLSVGYSFLRRLIVFFGFELHSNKIANNFLKKRRSEIAHLNYVNKIGFFKEGIQEKIHHFSLSRGIQGYYWNGSKNKYVWLRSSWEFIYAKWLNSQNNVVWDVECEQYKLSDNTSYRPDFFIFSNSGEIEKIVEIKGYWKDKSYKVDKLKDEYGLPVILIEDIKPYCEVSLSKEIKTWKVIRKLKLND